jgi:hypothetical protein
MLSFLIVLEVMHLELKTTLYFVNCFGENCWKVTLVPEFERKKEARPEP